MAGDFATKESPMEKEEQLEVIRELLDLGATVDLRIDDKVHVVPMAYIVEAMCQDIAEVVRDAMKDDVEVEEPDQGTDADLLKSLVLPQGYRPDHLVYNNEFDEIIIDSVHGVGRGDPRHPNALYDAFKRWNVVALDGNSEKGIKVHVPGITHDKSPNGILLRTAGNVKEIQEQHYPYWVRGSYAEDPRATAAGMISGEYRAVFTNGVFQAMVRKNHMEEGDHASLWLLAQDGDYPPEEDLFECVPGDSMGDGISINVHGGDEVFERFPQYNLREWTLVEAEVNPGTITFRINSTAVKVARNPFPNKPRYPLFTFESNGNWPTSFGKQTKYKEFGSEFEFGYWRIFEKR